MRETFTYGTVGRALGNQCFYPDKSKIKIFPSFSYLIPDVAVTDNFKYMCRGWASLNPNILCPTSFLI